MLTLSYSVEDNVQNCFWGRRFFENTRNQLQSTQKFLSYQNIPIVEMLNVNINASKMVEFLFFVNFFSPAKWPGM